MLATPDLVEEAAQPARLADLLPRWLGKVPLYSPPSHPPAPGQIDAEGVLQELERRPLITKQDIRHGFPHNFLGPEADLDWLVESGALELEHTSGTSEARTPLLLPLGWWAETVAAISQ